MPNARLYRWPSHESLLSRLSIGRSIRAWRTLCGRQMTRNARRAYAMPWVVRESTPIPGRFSRGSRAVWADSNSARPPCPPFVVSLTEPLGASQAAFAPSADPRNASQRARRGRASVFGLSPKGKPQSADRLGNAHNGRVIDHRVLRGIRRVNGRDSRGWRRRSASWCRRPTAASRRSGRGNCGKAPDGRARAAEQSNPRSRFACRVWNAV